MASATIRSYGDRRSGQFAHGSRRAFLPALAGRLDSLLTALDKADSLPDLDVTGVRPDTLNGDHNGFLALELSGNWCLDRRFEDGDA